MATRAEHYAQAEKLLEEIVEFSNSIAGKEFDVVTVQSMNNIIVNQLMRAQTHATLATVDEKVERAAGSATGWYDA